MIYPIKGQFKTFKTFIKQKGHNEKELDPKQIKNIPSSDKVVYLTFDTCPTDKVDFDIVNFLQDNNIEATIFLNIDWYKRNKAKDLSFLKNPLFSIGGHGYKHIRPIHQTVEEQTSDITNCINFIKNELETEVKLYRSPYGTPNEDTFNILSSLGIRFISWAGHVTDRESESVDYDLEKNLEIYMKQYIKSGDILIFHINLEDENSFPFLKTTHQILSASGFSFKKIN